MHASAKRLYQAAQELAGVTGQSAVARLLGQSPQTLKNWEVRGVSKEGALAAEARIGARAVWVMDGEAPMTSQANRHLTAGPRDPAMAHDLSRFQPEDAPHIDWGAIMEATQLAQIFWTTLPDDSMAPRAPEGKRVCFDRGLVPRPGDGVLVRDAHGGVHFRKYVAGAPGRWSAVALNPAYDPLDSERDGLQVLAVLKAEEGRWS